MRTAPGFSLIEVVISGALVATALGALFAIASMATRLTVQGQNRFIASELAREGIEVARQVRDTAHTDCEAERCHWYSGLFDPTTLTPASARAIELNPDTGFTLQDMSFDATRACTDYIARDLTEGGYTYSATPPTGGQREIYCRRLFFEPIDLPDTDEDERETMQAIRVRSQVAWLGYGRHAFHVPSIQETNSCDPRGTEWCTELITVLTNWRPGT